jgi:histidine triad (HIT) family protein
MSEDCIFCKIRDGKIPAKVLFRDERAFAFQDINPQAPLHALVVPNEHLPTLNDAAEADATRLGYLLLVAARIARDVGCAESGYRTVINCNRGAGQTVWHLHVHVLGGRALEWPPG